MELPDDILGLVREFAQPIKDRGSLKTYPSKWTKIDKANFLDYLYNEEHDVALRDSEEVIFSMESPYFDENMEAYYDIYKEDLIIDLLGRYGGKKGKLDGKTYRELGNLLDENVDNVYINAYTGKPFSDQLRARVERDEEYFQEQKALKKLKKGIEYMFDNIIPVDSNGKPVFANPMTKETDKTTAEDFDEDAWYEKNSKGKYLDSILGRIESAMDSKFSDLLAETSDMWRGEGIDTRKLTKEFGKRLLKFIYENAETNTAVEITLSLLDLYEPEDPDDDGEEAKDLRKAFPVGKKVGSYVVPEKTKIGKNYKLIIDDIWIDGDLFSLPIGWDDSDSEDERYGGGGGYIEESDTDSD
tara:strand:- start:154 stop:1224 length:1071 start_codon:yes stop_codon:yes gene_type:complete